MNIKERPLAAINHKKVDRIPTGYRGIDYLSQSLFKHFGFKDYNILEYRESGGRSDKRKHKSGEMFYVISGRGVIKVGSEEAKLKAGTVI